MGVRMQISKVNADQTQSVPRKTKNNQQYRASFKGGGNFVIGTMDAIDRGGLFASFMVQDLLGTILPRPLMGLHRNKSENKGKTNTAFALKEAIREVLTGPSMFIIPMGMLAASTKAIGKTVNVPAQLIDSFGGIFKDSVTKDNLANKDNVLKKTFYTNSIKKMLEDTTANKDVDFTKQASDLADEYMDLASHKTKTPFLKKLKGEYLKDSTEEVTNKFLNNFRQTIKKHAVDTTTDFTSVALGKKGTSIEQMLSHMERYADDAIKHVPAQINAAKGKDFTKVVADVLDNFNTKRINTRFGLNIGMTAAVISFLSIIPTLYNKTSKGNPGLVGLDDNNPPAAQTAATQQGKAAKPSFGSAEGFAKKIVGDGILSKFAKGIEYNEHNMDLPVMMTTMGGGVLAPRVVKAKDKYDLQEIVRRDVLTILTIVFGQKIISNTISKINEHRTGFVLAKKAGDYGTKKPIQKVLDYLKYSKGVNVLKSKQLIAKYSDIENYHGGVTGFCESIDKEGGNLSKLFGFNKNTKSALGNILGGEAELAKADNKTIIEAIKTAGKENIDKIAAEFKNGIDAKTGKSIENAFVKKAKLMNNAFDFAAMFILVPSILGIGIQKFNEKCTKKEKAKEKLEKEQSAKVSTQPANTTSANTPKETPAEQKTPSVAQVSSTTPTDATKKSVFACMEN